MASEGPGAQRKHTWYVNVKNRVSVTTAGEISARAAEDSMRLVLVPEDQDKAELCERGQDVCSGALLLHLLTDLDGAMSAWLTALRPSGGSSSKEPRTAYGEFPICVVAEV